LTYWWKVFRIKTHACSRGGRKVCKRKMRELTSEGGGGAGVRTGIGTLKERQSSKSSRSSHKDKVGFNGGEKRKGETQH